MKHPEEWRRDRSVKLTGTRPHRTNSTRGGQEREATPRSDCDQSKTCRTTRTSNLGGRREGEETPRSGRDQSKDRSSYDRPPHDRTNHGRLGTSHDGKWKETTDKRTQEQQKRSPPPPPTISTPPLASEFKGMDYYPILPIRSIYEPGTLQ